MKLEIPDLDHINQENSTLLDSTSHLLTSLQSFINSNTHIELDLESYNDMKSRIDTLEQENVKLKQRIRI